jgi:hypothetical protein
MRNLTPLENLERSAFCIGIFVLLVFLLASTDKRADEAQLSVGACAEASR